MRKPVRLFRFILILFSSFVFQYAEGQEHIRLRLQPPAIPGADTMSYYLSGPFNRWNPRDSMYRFRESQGYYWLEMPIPEKKLLECKITRGNWSAGETDADGFPAPNRIYSVTGDTRIDIRVVGWADLVTRKHTSTVGVSILSDSFPMKTLQDNRKIWIYLPPSYHNGSKKYPVIYMEDGQNLFDRASSAFGTEWRVDETLDSLAGKGYPEYIVVGIASGEKRLQEYMPYSGSRIKDPSGKDYARFITGELVPFVDTHYRTKKESRYRTVAGSSMGALISLYLLMEYPGVFGNAGIFSGAYWVVEPFTSLFCSKRPATKSSIYFYAGSDEMEGLEGDTRKLSASMRANCNARVQFDMTTGGKHSEAYWQRPFRDFIVWISK